MAGEDAGSVRIPGAVRALARYTSMGRKGTTLGRAGQQNQFVRKGARYSSGVLRARALDTRRDSLHLILAVELHFFQLNFFQEIF
jgi:hypothetical protein